MFTQGPQAERKSSITRSFTATLANELRRVYWVSRADTVLFMTSAGVHDKFQVTAGITVRRVCRERTSVFSPGVSHVCHMLEVSERGGLPTAPSLQELPPSTQVVRGKQAGMSLRITSEVESQWGPGSPGNISVIYHNRRESILCPFPRGSCCSPEILVVLKSFKSWINRNHLRLTVYIYLFFCHL